MQLLPRIISLIVALIAVTVAEASESVALDYKKVGDAALALSCKLTHYMDRTADGTVPGVSVAAVACEDGRRFNFMLREGKTQTEYAECRYDSASDVWRVDRLAAKPLPCWGPLGASQTSRSNESGISPTESNKEKIRADVLVRCRREMSSYGAAMVKSCVDMDMEAYQALSGYDDNHSGVIQRCKREMASYGWAMVKSCADMDIDAERALSQ